MENVNMFGVDSDLSLVADGILSVLRAYFGDSIPDHILSQYNQVADDLRRTQASIDHLSESVFEELKARHG